jgi:large subunit ribosomal protein L15
MQLNELRDRPGSRRRSKALGRGIGSGKGKTSGKGHKGQKARTGVSLHDFEGGQMPIYRRLPKRGFTNIFREAFDAVNLDTLRKGVESKLLDPTKPITEAVLREAGLAGRPGIAGVVILARGELGQALNIDVSRASKAAIAAIEKAGGKITVKERVKKVRDRKRRSKKGSKGAKAAEAPAEEAGASS